MHAQASASQKNVTMRTHFGAVAASGQDAASLLARKAAYLDYLSSHQLFGMLPRSELSRLCGAIRERRYSRGHHIAYEGDPWTQVKVIRSGLVALTQLDMRGNEHAVLLLHPDDIFDFSSAVQIDEHPWSCIALVDTTVLLFRIEMFNDLYQRFPEFGRGLAGVATRYMLCCGREIARYMLAPASARVAAFLLDLAQTPETGSIYAKDFGLDQLSRREIALLLGTTRETVSRTLARLCRSGAISIIGKCVLVRDPDVLRRFAGLK